MNAPVTLVDLVRNDKLLWVYCCDCGHERDVNPATLPLPAETPVPDVGKHMKCSVCGSRKSTPSQSCIRAASRPCAQPATLDRLGTGPLALAFPAQSTLSLCARLLRLIPRC